MRIKHEGNIPSWELDVKCGLCNTIITLEGAADMYCDSYFTIKTNSKYPALSFGYFCTCPRCEKKIQVPMNKIREDILVKIKYKQS